MLLPCHFTMRRDGEKKPAQRLLPPAAFNLGAQQEPAPGSQAAHLAHEGLKGL